MREMYFSQEIISSPVSLSATAKRMKELIETILFNEVCNQCLAFYAFYKRKNCILTSRFHNRRVWRATERFVDFFFVPLYATFALEYYA
jgi:hypothetical protein